MNIFNSIPQIICLILTLTPWALAETTIQVGTTYQFSQTANSTATYRISLPQPGEYKIHITNWISTFNWGADYDRLYLYNDEATPVQQGVFSSDSDPFAFHMFEDGDNLIFRVGTAGSYTMNVHSGTLDPGVSQAYGLQVTATYCNDAYEPNDTLATSTPITLGATIHAYQWKRGKNADVAGDEEYYRIQIPTPGKLKINLIAWEAVYNWGADFDRFFVYDATGKNIGGDPDAGDNGYYSWMMGGGTVEEPFSIEMNLAKAGTYYIRFHAGAATSLTPYSFATSFTQANDVLETNDTFATAKPILKTDTWLNAYAWRSLDQTMTVTGDEDYYYFHAAGPGQYTVTLENWIGIYDWGADYDRLYVYNASQQSVGASPLSWMMGTNPITFDIPAAGKYYILLHCGAGYSLDGYRIKLTGNLLGPDIAVEQPLRKNLVDGKATTNFGKVRVGKAGKPKSYTIRNKGITALNISKIRKSGTAAKSFLVTKPGKSSLAPGQSTTFKITFKPKAKGTLKAAIQVPNNDKDETPFDIKLLGTGLK